MSYICLGRNYIFAQVSFTRTLYELALTGYQPGRHVCNCVCVVDTSLMITFLSESCRSLHALAYYGILRSVQNRKPGRRHFCKDTQDTELSHRIYAERFPLIWQGNGMYQQARFIGLPSIVFIPSELAKVSVHFFPC